jgi:PAS domain S-box-containing protein
MSAKKVIIIEDDKMLSTVFKMFLTEIGHKMLGFYDSPKKAFKKIEEERPDVVLMDIFLPGDMDGIKASNYIQETYNIPVVYLSSSTDEEVIKRALESHIYGYLLKPIDKTSLRINIELACTKFDYHEILKYNASISKSMHSAITIINSEGEITWFNNSFILFFNVKKNTKFNYLFSNTGVNLFETITNEIKTNKFYESVINLKDRNNNIISYLITASSLQINANEIVASIDKIPIEFNSQNKTSKLLVNYNTFIENSSDAVFFIDEKNKIFDFNKLAKNYCKTIFNVSIIKDIKIFEVLNFFNKAELRSLIHNVKDGISHFLERRVETNGKVVFLRINFSPILDDEVVKKYCIIINDITKLKTVEQNYINLKSELEPIVESSIQKFYLLDLNYNIIAFNKSANEIIQKEFSKQMKKGDSILNFVPPEMGISTFKNNFKKALNGEHLVTKYKAKLPDGIFTWNESHLDPVINEKGEIYNVLLWTLDITENEQNVLELKKSQERYELVAIGGNDGIWDWDMINNEIYISPRWKAVLGYEDFEIENKFGTRDSLIHPDDLITSEKTLKKYLAGETDVFENEIRLKHKNGEYRWILERGIALKNIDKKAYRLAGSITDITERKIMIEKLSEINKSLLIERKLFDKGNIAVIKVNINTMEVIYASNNINYILGYTEKDFIDGSVDIDSLIHEEDQAKHKNERKLAFEQNLNFIEYSDYRILKKDGNIVWIRDFTIIENVFNTNETQLLGYYIDVTAYKQLELKSKESEDKFSKLFNYANDAILIIDGNKIIDSNKSAVKLFGYTEKELLVININQLSPELQPSGTNTKEKRVRKLHEAREGNNEPFYWKYKNKNDDLIDSEVSVTYVSIDGKYFYHILIRDITYRKQIEETLKENKQKYESILASIPDMVLIIDNTGVCKYFKPDYEKKYNFDEEIVLGKGVEYFFSDVKRVTIVKYIKDSIDNNKILNYKFETSTPAGVKSFEARITPLSEKEVIAIVRDIDKV